MAKKNCVHLLGYVDRLIEENEGRLSFTIKIRKNQNKFVYPIVYIYTKKFHVVLSWQKERLLL